MSGDMKLYFGKNQMMPLDKYIPIFVGRTVDNEKIVIYKRPDDSLHIFRPDKELLPLGPNSVIEQWADIADFRHHIRITSNVWSGTASGTRAELIEEPMLLSPPKKEKD